MVLHALKRKNGNFCQESVVVWRNERKILVLVTIYNVYIFVNLFFSELMWYIFLYLGWNCWWLWWILSLCSRASWIWTFQTLSCCWDWRSCSRCTVEFNGFIFAGMLIDVSVNFTYLVSVRNGISVWIFALLTSIWNQIAEN
jgi:hypothetical protein